MERHYRRIRGDMIEMYKILSGKYDAAVTPRVMREHSYITGRMILGWRKVEQNTTCANIILLTGQLIFGIVCLTMLCYVILLINLNFILINFGSTKMLFMIIKLKFTEPEAEVYMIRISYIGFQYFVSFGFVMQA